MIKIQTLRNVAPFLFRVRINRISFKYFTSAQSIRQSNDVSGSSSPVFPYENEFMRNILVKSNFSNSLAFIDGILDDCSGSTGPTTNFECQQPHELVQSLKKYIYLFDKQPVDTDTFLRLCTTLEPNVKHLSEQNAMLLLKLLIMWPIKRTSLFYALCRELDEYFLQPNLVMTTDKCLLIMDHFYRLDVIRFSEFVTIHMKRLWRKVEKLTSKQLVQMMFLVNTKRKWHPSVNLINVECALAEHFYELSLDEAAIIALGFFKTAIPIRSDDLLKKMYMKLSQNVDSVHSITLTAYLKVFQLSTSMTLVNDLRDLLRKLAPVMDDKSLMCCVHIALLGTTYVILDSDCIRKASERLICEIKTARMKDIERMLLALHIFNVEPETKENVFEVALDELKSDDRAKDIVNFSHSFVLAVTYAALQGHYDYTLLNIVLSTDFLEKAFGGLQKLKVPRDILVLANSVVIECPDYSGNNIDDRWRTSLTKRACAVIASPDQKNKSVSDRILLDVSMNLKKMFGNTEFVHYCYVLPHFPRPDVLICLNKEKLPQKLPESILNSKVVGIHPVPDANDWIVIIFVGFRTSRYGSYEPSGKVAAKIRQLRKLGYKPITIIQKLWEQQTDVGKPKYLQSLIEKV